MITGITWAQAVSVLILVLALYYGILILSIIRAKLQGSQHNNLNNGNLKKRVWSVEEKEMTEEDRNNEQAAVHGAGEEQLEEWEPTGDDSEDEKLFDNLEALASDIEDIFAKDELVADKDALFESLRQQIAGYPSLTGAAFKNALANLIMRKAAERNISITRPEALGLWQE